MSLEDGIERIARANGKPAVVLCDRGMLDGCAYMIEEEWKELLTVGVESASICSDLEPFMLTPKDYCGE